MFAAEIIAVGRMKDGPFSPLWQEYAARLGPALTLHEIVPRKAAEEELKILEKIDSRAFLFVLDERGKTLTSQAFAKKIETLCAQGTGRFQFLVGGADGLSDSLRQKADCLLSFGAQTWPHMLARVMLAEQIYRARQIITGHPYHRE